MAYIRATSTHICFKCARQKMMMMMKEFRLNLSSEEMKKCRELRPHLLAQIVGTWQTRSASGEGSDFTCSPSWRGFELRYALIWIKKFQFLLHWNDKTCNVFIKWISLLQASTQYITQFTVPAVVGFFRSIALSHGSSLQDTLRLLTLWFDYGQWPEVYDAIVDGIRTIEIDTWLQVIS